MRGSLCVKGGIACLVNCLAEGLLVERRNLNCAVVAIRQWMGGLIVSARRDGVMLDIVVRQIVFAVPPRIVERGVSFCPKSTAEQSQTLRRIPTWMAGQAKIMAVYNHHYWRAAGFSEDVISHSGPLAEIHDAAASREGPFAVFGFVGVSAQIRRDRRNEVIETARAQLVSLFGRDMARPKALLMQDRAENSSIATSLDQNALQGHLSYGLAPVMKGLWDEGCCSLRRKWGPGLVDLWKALSRLLGPLPIESTGHQPASHWTIRASVFCR